MMYDNLAFKYNASSTNTTDFLTEIPQYFNVKGEHLYTNNNKLVITGDLGGEFKISVRENGVNITGGSLAKYYLGNNFQTLTRKDTQRAIEKLSDTLHIPVHEATMSRIDVSTNMIVKYPPDVYFNHLGNSDRSTRLPQPNGIYYDNNTRKRLFYDKVKEQKAKGQPIPELYAGRNTLRYEQRYLKLLPKTFNVEHVTGAMLYDEQFYINIIDRWVSGYDRIEKINDIEININAMKSVKEFNNLGILSLIQISGGQLALFQQIAEFQRRGEITKKQAYDLRAAIKRACEVNGEITRPNDAIQELTTKIHQAASCYR